MKRTEKAVFLDRDGVLITERGGYSFLQEHIEILTGTAEALKVLQDSGFLLIVATNQGGISRSFYTHTDVDTVHKHIAAHYSELGVTITDFFYCPHHPEFTECLCRKPGSLMLEKAMAIYHIDAARSWFIGDNPRDIEAGVAAGVKTILIPSNSRLDEYIGGII